MAGNGNLTLEVLDLHKSYGETQAVTALDMVCRPGTVHTVFGENGSGKSTLVKIVSGIIPPDRGEVRVNGRPVTAFDPNAMRELGIAPVLQEVLVAPNRSVLDNIFLGFDGLFRRRIAKDRRPEIAREALARISRVGIDLDQSAGALPLAQQQVVVVARALVRNPDILILDEATAALDIDDRETLFEAIRELVAEGRLVIFISHRIDEVLELSDQVTVLRNGQAVATVPRSELSSTKLLELVSPESVVRERVRV